MGHAGKDKNMYTIKHQWPPEIGWVGGEEMNEQSQRILDLWK